MQLRKLTTLVAGLTLVAGVLAADVPGELGNWARGPASHLMTRQEQQDWKNLKTTSDAEKFIALFWARRDPTPETPQNEFLEEIDRRVQFANEAFTQGRTPGSMSDRGKVLIVIGPPYQRKTSSDAPTPNVQTPGGPTTPPREEIWVYEKDKLPAFAGMPIFEIAFVDQNHTGNWRLGHSPGVNVNDLLEKGRNAYLVSPDMNELPNYEAYLEAQRRAAMLPPPAKAGVESSAIRSAIESFRAAEESPHGQASLTFSEYITPDGQYFVALQLYFDSDAGVAADQDVTFFGVLETPDGDVAAAYEEPIKVRANSGGETYVDRSLIVDPGTYNAVFGVAAGDRILAMAKAEVELAPVSPTEPSVSRLVLSKNIFALTEAQMPTDPFAFGGLKVVPQGNLTFSQDDEMWYFFEMRHPGLDSASGAPKVQVQIEVATEISGQSKKRRQPLMEAVVQQVKDTPGHFIVGSSIPLAGFEASEYDISVRVIDSVARKTYNLDESFKIIPGTAQ